MNDRVRRLCMCALVRECWPLLDRGGRLAVEAAENFADGRVTPDRLERVRRLAGKTVGMYGVESVQRMAALAAFSCAASSMLAILADTPVWAKAAGLRQERRQHICRDMEAEYDFDVSAEMVGLAQEIYDRRGQEGAFNPILLALLADLLDDHGIVHPLRDGQRRYRGSRLIDHILGK